MKSSSRRLLLIWVKRNRLKHEGYFGISLSAQTGAAAANRYYSVGLSGGFCRRQRHCQPGAGGCFDNVILGKPQDAAAAKAMLQRLSGRTHQVMTGVAVRYKGQQLSKVCITDVSFRQLTAEEIDAYIATGEPMDKAGAYGIQGRGAVLVEKINGCYNNVVGLPLSLLYLMMQRLGV